MRFHPQHREPLTPGLTAPDRKRAGRIQFLPGLFCVSGQFIYFCDHLLYKYRKHFTKSRVSGKQKTEVKWQYEGGDCHAGTDTTVEERPDASGRYRWPRNSREARDLTRKQFDWLMSGLDIEQPKASRERERLLQEQIEVMKR